jgi:hypothetical protein
MTYAELHAHIGNLEGLAFDLRNHAGPWVSKEHEGVSLALEHLSDAEDVLRQLAKSIDARETKQREDASTSSSSRPSATDP